MNVIRTSACFYLAQPIDDVVVCQDLHPSRLANIDNVVLGGSTCIRCLALGKGHDRTQLQYDGLW